jgi:hypothetical protein
MPQSATKTATNTTKTRSKPKWHIPAFGVRIPVRLLGRALMNIVTHKESQPVGVWHLLVTDRPDSERKILCAYRVPNGWQVCLSIYYPHKHRIYVNNEPWFGDMIGKRDVHWMELPAAPDMAAVSASESEG